MEATTDWAFADSPALVLTLDSALLCRGLSRPWREKADLVGRDETAIPAGDLLDFGGSPQLETLLENLFDRAAPLSDFKTNLLMQGQAVPATVSAWHADYPDIQQSCLMLIARITDGCADESAELEQLRSQYQLILDSAGEGIYGLDKEGRITFSNRASTAILGWESDDVMGRYSHEIHHHSHADGSKYPRDECPIYASIKDGEVHHVESEVFWHTDGTAVCVAYTSTPIIQDGELAGAVIVFKNISDRKAMEKQRELAYEEIKVLKEKLELERDYLRDEVNNSGNFGEIIGDSDVLKRTLAQVEAVAQTPASVLILGESGVGKEMIARAIHRRSDRVDCPLIKVNCASIPNDLFESEFFGHVKGSFTGAHQDRIGRLQLADSGTLFLDEVGEIPLAQQGKLLRALQESEFEKVGDDKTLRVNVRVVAATNRDLSEEVKEGRFREDLFYRLSVFPIEVPPLRDRIDDVIPIAASFLEKACTELRRESLALTQNHISALKSHSWPGNIRELKNVIDRAVISSTGKKLRLDLAITTAATKAHSRDESPQSSYLSSAEFRELEKANIIAALQHADWKIWGVGGAAELLGLKPSTLAYQMKTLGIRKPDKGI